MEETPTSGMLLLASLFWEHNGGNQRELARQKNAKKQTDGGKGKRLDDGLSAAARKQSEIMSEQISRCPTLMLHAEEHQWHSRKAAEELNSNEEQMQNQQAA
ncbi:hypothetical protein PAMA_000262 [Pampus argenteus]